MKYQTIEQMINELKYERPDSYSGPEYHGYIGVMGQNRDSDCLSRSNFSVACEMLGYDFNRPVGDEVVMSRASHWLCGWVNILYVSIESPEKLKIVFDMLNALDDYPVLNEDDFYQLERDELDEMIKSNMKYFERDFAKYLGKTELNNAEKSFIIYNIEESASYHGHEDAWFDLGISSVSRTIRLIRENGFCDDSIQMNELINQLEFALEFEKSA